MKRVRRLHAFILLEAMLAVAVFSIGVIALGNCVQNCIIAEQVKEEDARARRILDNRMAEIEAGSIPIADKASEELKGMFAGMTLKTTRVPLKRKNEKNQEVFGLFAITLNLSWVTDRKEQSKELSFYVYPRQR